MAAEVVIKFDGVDGESTMANHVGWTECTGFSEGQSCSSSVTAGTGSAVGKPEFHPFSLSAIQGKHTNMFRGKMFDGVHFPKVEVHYVKQTGNPDLKPYYIITMEKCFVTSIMSGNTAGTSDLPHESWSFTAEKATWEYFTQGADGSLTSTGKVTYDCKEAKSS